jgi:hypothetical protein
LHRPLGRFVCFIVVPDTSIYITTTLVCFRFCIMSTPEESYSTPPQLLSFDGLLFDFDGTIVDSKDGKDTLPFVCLLLLSDEIVQRTESSSSDR